MVTEKIFETALGISSPWFIAGMNFDQSQRKLNIRVDFEVGSRFAVPGQAGEHPVHDTVTKTYRHLNFFQYECVLEVRIPRVKLPDGSVRQVSPEWAGKLSGFTPAVRGFRAAAGPRDDLHWSGAHQRAVGPPSDESVRALRGRGGQHCGLQRSASAGDR